MTLSAATVGTTAKRQWSPKELGTALLGWYDADDSATVSLSGSDVTQWDDKSGNGNHGTQGTSANRPTYASSRITFDGSNDRIEVAGINLTLDRTFAMIVKVSSGGNGVKTIVSGMDAANLALRYASSQHQFSRTGFIDFAKSSYTATTNADIVLVGTVTGTTWAFRQNGTSSTGTHSTTVNTATMKIGGAYYGNEFFNGSIREFIVASARTTGEMQSLEGYLAWKWGLQANLPNDHPYKNIRP